MPASLERQITRLLKLAKESAQIMWSSYDIHLSRPIRDPDWQEKGWKLFARCVAADARVSKLMKMEAESVMGGSVLNGPRQGR
jgi:hypothetical protein